MLYNAHVNLEEKESESFEDQKVAEDQEEDFNKEVYEKRGPHS